MNMKVHYQKHLVRSLIRSYNSGEIARPMNMKQAISMLFEAWENVRPESIEKCFAKAGFLENKGKENSMSEMTVAMMSETMVSQTMVVLAPETTTSGSVWLGTLAYLPCLPKITPMPTPMYSARMSQQRGRLRTKWLRR